MKTFKDRVLDSLNINIEPKFDAADWKTDQSDFNNNLRGLSNKSTEEQIRNGLSNFIDAALKKEVALEKNNKKGKTKQLEASLRTFTLNDILKRAKGIDISKGFYKSTNDDYLKRAEADINNYADNKKNNIKYRKEELNDNIDVYLILQDVDNLKKGDFIMSYKTKKSPNSSPGSDVELAIKKLFGGSLNPGLRDAIKDISYGAMNISIKCYSPGNKIDVGSINALNNFSKDVIFDVYRYHKFDGDLNGAIPSNEIKFLITHDLKECFIIKDGKIYDLKNKALYSKRGNKSTDIKIKNRLFNKLSDQEIKQRKLKILSLIKDQDLKNEIQQKLVPGNMQLDILKNKINISKEKEKKQIIDILDSFLQSSVETKYFNY